MSPAAINWRPPATRAAISSSFKLCLRGESAAAAGIDGPAATAGIDGPNAAAAGAVSSMLSVASDPPLGALCSLTRTAVITTACTKIATVAAVADQASVRGVRLDRNSERRLPRSNVPVRRGACASWASLAVNNFPMARADGAPRDSLGWIVSTSSTSARDIQLAKASNPTWISGVIVLSWQNALAARCSRTSPIAEALSPNSSIIRRPQASSFIGPLMSQSALMRFFVMTRPSSFGSAQQQSQIAVHARKAGRLLGQLLLRDALHSGEGRPSLFVLA